MSFVYYPMSKISFLLPNTYSYVARVAKRFQTMSAEELSNEKFPFFGFRFVQNGIILYIFEAEAFPLLGNFHYLEPLNTKFIRKIISDTKRTPDWAIRYILIVIKKEMVSVLIYINKWRIWWTFLMVPTIFR